MNKIMVPFVDMLFNLVILLILMVTAAHVNLKPQPLATAYVMWAQGAPQDIDSHIWTPRGEIWYGKKSNPYAWIDRDDLGQNASGVINLEVVRFAKDGEYPLSVRNFSNHSGSPDVTYSVEVEDSTGIVCSKPATPVPAHNAEDAVFTVIVKDGKVQCREDGIKVHARATNGTL